MLNGLLEDIQALIKSILIKFRFMFLRKIVLILILVPAFYGLSQSPEVESMLRMRNGDSTEGWKISGTGGISLSQTSLTNWSAGGQNSVSINTTFSLNANFKKKKHVWDNSLDIGYGLLKQGDYKKFMKTDDKIDLLTKYGYNAFDGWFYAGMVNFKTQMRPGYNYPNDSVKISDFLAPAYLLTALGMDYKPNDHFSAFIAPATYKLTIVRNQDLADAGAFGVKSAIVDEMGIVQQRGEFYRSEIGGYIRLIYSRNDFNAELLKNVAFTTKLDLFSNYQHNPQNIDVSWETIIALKVNKFLTVNFNTHLLYDDDIKIAIDSNNDGITDKEGPRVQFKEILGVGLMYKF